MILVCCYILEKQGDKQTKKQKNNTHTEKNCMFCACVQIVMPNLGNIRNFTVVSYICLTNKVLLIFMVSNIC
jgi:hypothetical protein